jgi:regulatory protein
MLDVRSRTTKEMRQRLARRGYDAAAIDGAVERLLAVGLLDDVAYARQYTRGRLAAGEAAPSRVQHDLVRRGLERETAVAVVRDVMAEEQVDLTVVLDDLVRRRARTLARFDDATRRRRLYAYLARRGFETEAIRGALARVLPRG